MMIFNTFIWNELFLIQIPCFGKLKKLAKPFKMSCINKSADIK